MFARQTPAYRQSVVGPADAVDAMVITNGAFKLMADWADGPLVREYSLSSDWDDRWRTGGSVDEVIEEAHLDEAHILAALERFAADRPDRLRRLQGAAGRRLAHSPAPRPPPTAALVLAVSGFRPGLPAGFRGRFR